MYPIRILPFLALSFSVPFCCGSSVVVFAFARCDQEADACGDCFAVAVLCFLSCPRFPLVRLSASVTVVCSARATAGPRGGRQSTAGGAASGRRREGGEAHTEKPALTHRALSLARTRYSWGAGVQAQPRPTDGRTDAATARHADTPPPTRSSSFLTPAQPPRLHSHACAPRHLARSAALQMRTTRQAAPLWRMAQLRAALPLCIATMLALLLSPSAVTARLIYTSNITALAPPATSCGDNVTTACQSLASAVVWAVPGDEIVLLPGVHPCGNGWDPPAAPNPNMGVIVSIAPLKIRSLLGLGSVEFNCLYLGGAILFDSVPMDVEGIIFTAGVAEMGSALRTDGTNAVGFTHSVTNCAFKAQLGYGGGSAIDIRFNGPSSDNLVRIINCTFEGGTLVSQANGGFSGLGYSAGAVAVIYTGAGAGSYSRNRFLMDNCALRNNSGGNVWSNGLSAGAGAVLVYYDGTFVDRNSELITRTTFYGNTGGNGNAQLGAAALAVVVSSSPSTVESQYLLHSTSIDQCTFLENAGGNDNCLNHQGGAGAGAVLIAFQPLSTLVVGMRNNTQNVTRSIFRANQGGNNNGAITGVGASGAVGAAALAVFYFNRDKIDAANNTMNDNSFYMDSCTVEANQGGNDNARSVSYFAGSSGGGGAAGVLVTFLSLSGGLATGLDAINSQALRNTQRITGSTFRANLGGNNNAAGPSGGGAGAAALNILYFFVRVAAVDNTQAIADTAFIANEGGNANGAGGPGGVGAGALSVLYIAVDGNPLFRNNVQSLLRCVWQSNRGGNLNAAGGTGAGGGAAAASLVFYANTPSVALAQLNLQLVLNNLFLSNEGGSGNAGGGGTGASGLHVLYFLLAGNASFIANTQAITNTLFDGNLGGSKNGGIEDVQEGALSGGGSGATITYFYTCRATSAPPPSTFALNSLRVVSSNFTGNVGTSGLGLAFIAYPTITHAPSNNELLVQDCRFERNVAFKGGGLAVMDMDGGYRMTLQATHLSFERNAASCLPSVCCCSGGGVMLSNLQANLVDTDFSNNTASYSGGAILLLQAANASCARCGFHQNKAEIIGDLVQMQGSGALYLSDAALVLARSITRDTSPTVAFTGWQPLRGIADDAGSSPTGLSSVQLTCPQGSIVYSTPNAIGCELCPAGSYLMQTGVFHRGSTDNSVCSPCPYGADCLLGGADLRIKQGFFGLLANLNRSVHLSSCPPVSNSHNSFGPLRHGCAYVPCWNLRLAEFCFTGCGALTG